MVEFALEDELIEPTGVSWFYGGIGAFDEESLSSKKSNTTSSLIEKILQTIKMAQSQGQKMVWFDFSDGSPRFIIANTILSALTGVGFVCYLSVAGGESSQYTERLYIDLTRKRGSIK